AQESNGTGERAAPVRARCIFTRQAATTGSPERAIRETALCSRAAFVRVHGSRTRRRRSRLRRETRSSARRAAKADVDLAEREIEAARAGHFRNCARKARARRTYSRNRRAASDVVVVQKIPKGNE